MKAVAGLEILMRKCEEWESYSPKRFSMKGLQTCVNLRFAADSSSQLCCVYVDPLSALWSLCVRYRKLELESWTDAFVQREEVQFQQTARYVCMQPCCRCVIW